jgi:glycosyltransferase involved in cell wall biosynthesis
MLVSAIMPTRGRPALARKAVQCFLDQTWWPAELLIMDDAECRSFDAAPREASIRYWLHEQRLTIGAKRNALCKEARGEFIIHFDSDDWSDPQRIDDQVERLLTTHTEVTGYHSLLFWSMKSERGRLWDAAPRPVHNKPGTITAPVVTGTSLCYRRRWWERHQFENRQTMEDTVFGAAAHKEGVLSSVDSRGLIVARAEHGENTSTARDISKLTGWPYVARSSMPPRFLEHEGIALAVG